MRRERLLLVAALWFAMTGSAWAVESGVDLRVAFYRWEEELQPVGFIDPLETGPMAFVGGWLDGAPMKTHPALRLRADLRLLVGYVNYETALIAAPTVPINTNTSYFGSIQEASVGWRIKRTRWSLEPFGAVAYRWWLRSIESNSSAMGYDEWYQMVVLRLGMRSELAISDRAALYGEFSGDPTLWAKESIDGVLAGEVIRVENGKRLGWTIETGLRARQVDLGVFWQAVRLGESTVDQGFFQPPSDQDIIGLKAAVSF
ncbi:MAG: hypothetical protein ACOYXU_13970 [Nitrospirota bacterium]